MQLFILDSDPVAAVRSLADVHLVKMCLETAQILSSVMVRRGLTPAAGMPKPYNLRHPVIVAADTPEKVAWVTAYNAALHAEYRYRFGRTHRYAPLAELYSAMLDPDGIPGECRGLARVFRDFTVEERDLVAAHRCYYRFKKGRIARWRYTKRPEPEWLTVPDGE